MTKPKRIPVKAIRLVERNENPLLPPELQQRLPDDARAGRVEQLKNAVQDGNWSLALLCVNSHKRITLCIELWRIIPEADKPRVLAEAISGGDNPRYEHMMLCAILRMFHHNKQRAFDCDKAREAFKALPEAVTIYRGTVEAEGDDYGICWTLSRETAVFFATKHCRFRNTTSPPVIVSATVNRDDIGGLLIGREENEVLIWPGLIKDASRSTP